MKKLRNVFYAVIVVLLCCKKPYDPHVISSPNSYLVVEGVINSGNDSTIIKLSKTVKLSGKVVQNPVLGAIVTIESDQNITYKLLDVNNTGYYGAPPLHLAPSQKYRLHIKSPYGNEYLSDFVPVKPTPPIDSVGYIIQGDNLNIYVNAHDPTNNTRYYRWDYDETWQFHSLYESFYVLDTVTHTIVPRPDSLMNYNCFGNYASSTILLNSTVKLAQDVVYQSPVTQFSIHAERIETKYSILLKQYALTKEAYEFYQNIKTTTEQLGNIFDAQPTQLIGNIHNVRDASEPVIGFVTVTNTQSKRIYIANNVLPMYTKTDYPYDCEEKSAYYGDETGNDVQTILINPPLTDIPTSGIPSHVKYGALVGYGYSTPICVDCTLRGKTKPPSFWK